MRTFMISKSATQYCRFPIHFKFRLVRTDIFGTIYPQTISDTFCMSINISLRKQLLIVSTGGDVLSGSYVDAVGFCQ